MPLAPTPWLNPPDYTSAYLQGAQIGASATEARNRLAATMAEANARTQASIQESAARLAHQEQMAQMQAQARMQISAQRAREAQQRIAIDAAYKESQIGLDKQRLQEAHQANQFKLMQYASQQAAVMQAQKEIEAGGDPNEVWSRLGVSATGSLAGVAPMARAARPVQIPESVWVPDNPETGERAHWVNQKTGAVTQARTQPLDPYTAVQRDAIKDRLVSLNKELAEATKEKVRKEKRDQIAAANEELRQLLSPGSPSKGLPMPNKLEELKVGEVYQIPRWGGAPGKWNGKTFDPL